MILTEPRVALAQLESDTGWVSKPEGLCKGDICVPLPAGSIADDGTVDVSLLNERLGMALVHDEAKGLWAVGPETIAGSALTSVAAPELELPDIRTGESFKLSSLRGKKAVIVSWASW